MTDMQKKLNSGEAQILQWVQQLGTEETTQRYAARQSLVDSGEAAVPALINALGEPSDLLRWEAAKLLNEIQHTSAIPALIETLADKNSGIRWVAGDALIQLGESAVTPLLQAILIDTSRLRDGAYHVLHHHATRNDQFRETLSPVVEALKSLDASVAVPIVAEKALLKISGLG
ncbi:hypothetical protein MNBD_PLANCTO02-2138 [hydrothermal vent metagenome]|uniref:Uncharacterized protein n=1 Tax=hydrothermal vent metagenome TaxID=652676 RepID=A0A3B1E0B9_9ZZZZ